MFSTLSLLLACTDDPKPGDSAEPEPIVLLDATGTHHGHTLAEWEPVWWQWTLEHQGEDNPIFDATGEDCAVGQSGEVFFLAGTTGGPAERTCAVPAGRALLFPIVTTVVDNAFATPGDERSEQELRDAVTEQLGLTENLALEIDGTTWDDAALAAYEVGPTVFSYTLPDEPNFYSLCCATTIVGRIDPAVSGGFWAMLEPLPAGEHEITFSGNSVYSGYPFEVEVTYHLTVE